ncbi:14550_t:CDS:2 [Acaulospora colombiana]|uniref:14550_t:CDS:1 n=1 Tax=Acaulospora colombiana TaxID=27376 RepID=A0ACA9KF84_9GLOM|nr:14550_t:CDS:2 [Acaulospora colombiana]
MGVHIFESSHEDLIHDVSYDFYGKRLATCSSDQRVKVWECNQDNKWELVDSWRAHDCSVLKVSWAHPEFGQILATCSFDRTIRIWEEQVHEAKNSGKRWPEKATLRDGNSSVQDVEFAPNCWGLKFASCTADGMLRIYEALEVNNLAQWTLVEEIGITGHNTKEDSTQKWQPHETLEGHTDPVHDVSWAPNMGRWVEVVVANVSTTVEYLQEHAKTTRAAVQVVLGKSEETLQIVMGCSNINWARRVECNQCKTPKPGSETTMGSREGRGGGFMERDEVVEYRKSRDAEKDDEYDEFGRKRKKNKDVDSYNGGSKDSRVSYRGKTSGSNKQDPSGDIEDEDEGDDDDR